MAAGNSNRKNVFGKLATVRLSLRVFLLVWFAYGVAINSANLRDFDLQQIGVEALVERGHFYLEGSPSPHMQTKGDVFEFQGHKYAAKQPGQFMVGAVPYFLLHKFGLSYANHYLLTAALVTFLTTSLILAASASALFELAREFNKDGRGLFWPLAAALSYAFGTTAFAYSGIAHHDALATGYLVIAFYLLVRLSREDSARRTDGVVAAATGLLLGLTITTSMLPFFMVLIGGLYFFWLRRWRMVPLFLLGMLAGLLPLFIYDAVSFGNPFLLPNIAGAGMFGDTFFHFDPRNWGNKLAFYAHSLALYVPIFVMGLLGLSYYPRELKRRTWFVALLALMILLLLFVGNIDSDGDCQFGPRYLLPAMPFGCLGLVGFSYLSQAWERKAAKLMIVFVGSGSFLVNGVGAFRGAMNCPHGEQAFWKRLVGLQTGEALRYPLAVWLIIPLLVLLVLIAMTLNRPRKAGI